MSSLRDLLPAADLDALLDAEVGPPYNQALDLSGIGRGAPYVQVTVSTQSTSEGHTDITAWIRYWA